MHNIFYLLIIYCLTEGVMKTNTCGFQEKQQPIALGALICSFYLLVHN